MRIFISNDIEIGDRCVAARTTKATDDENQSFIADAFVPDLSRARALRTMPAENSGLRFETGSYVYVGKVAEPFYHSLRRMRRSQSTTDLQVVEATIREILKATADDPNIDINAPFGWNGFAVNPPNLISTTRGHEGRYLGLHYDDFESRTVVGRDAARNRICINLGEYPRGFSFWPVEMKNAVKMLGDLATPEASSAEIIRLLTRRRKIEEVVTIILYSGEFYVAPTENIPHDGHTKEIRTEDISLTIRAYIKFMPTATREVADPPRIQAGSAS